MKKLTIEEVRARINQINPNVQLLEKSYIDNRTNMKCRCKKCHHIWNARFSNLTRKDNPRGCPKCGGTKNLILKK